MTKKLTRKNDIRSLSLLGKDSVPQKNLEVFPNHHTKRDYVITLVTGEFTSLGPVNRQPDFATITIQYIPDKFILESKSLKLYLQTFRDQETFYEHVVNVILDDLVAVLKPRWCKVTAAFAVRGGIAMTVETEYKSKK
ncbi:MAG: NADPH-dependent 7-cyano-7-deazaguanine reductase QueF [Ignavibacteriales bacterium]|nr:NADPH-dependent 7-cyano-7-deazaguanine reductase QueF [Ignavibacteriales bacterium]